MSRYLKRNARPSEPLGTEADARVAATGEPHAEGAEPRHSREAEPGFVEHAESGAKEEGHGHDPAPDGKPRPREGHGGEHVNLGREEPFSSAARVEAEPDRE